jgi:putative two-component system response regulator
MGETATILIVEDNPATLELLGEMLTQEDSYHVLSALTARDAFQILREQQPDLVLLDVGLPDESGFNLCQRMKSVSTSFVPIVLVTALNDVADKVRGLEVGADDFITKPILREELVARTRSHLRTKRMLDRVEGYRNELSRFNQRLQEQVEIRTRQLQSALAELKRAKEEVDTTQRELVERLGMAAEYRDEWTGNHIRRVAGYVYETALAYGLSQARADMLCLAAPLHDIGKMGVRDHVLLKPDQLEEGEVELIREHTTIGAEILADPKTELMRIAWQMARSHHERWDGQGYPDGLTGAEIPLAARICAVADVFDALTSTRVYRPGCQTAVDALAEIQNRAGSRFDPKVVTAFSTAFEQIEQIMEQTK